MTSEQRSNTGKEIIYAGKTQNNIPRRRHSTKKALKWDLHMFAVIEELSKGHADP